jgi:LPXTG-motif cell wall-anchored protein
VSVAVARTMQRDKEPKASATSRTPIWVWVVYGLGILGAAILVFSTLFAVGAYVLANDLAVSLNVSLPAFLVWGGLALVAAALWISRRRRR